MVLTASLELDPSKAYSLGLPRLIPLRVRKNPFGLLYGVPCDLSRFIRLFP